VLHVAKVLDEHGADAAAALLAAAGQRVDLDTAKELTYLLYSICERNGWEQQRAAVQRPGYVVARS